MGHSQQRLVLSSVIILETLRSLVTYAAVQDPAAPTAAAIALLSELIKVVLTTCAVAHSVTNQNTPLTASSFARSVAAVSTARPGAAAWPMYLTLVAIAGTRLLADLLLMGGLMVTTPVLLSLTVLAKLPVAAVIHRFTFTAQRTHGYAWLSLVAIAFAIVLVNLPGNVSGDMRDIRGLPLGVSLSLLIAVSSALSGVCTEQLVQHEVEFWVIQFWTSLFGAILAALLCLVWNDDPSTTILRGSFGNIPHIAVGAAITMALAGVLISRASETKRRSVNLVGASAPIVVLIAAQTAFFPDLISETLTTQVVFASGIMSVSLWIYDHFKHMTPELAGVEESDVELSKTLVSEKVGMQESSPAPPSARHILRASTIVSVLCTLILIVRRAGNAADVTQSVAISPAVPIVTSTSELSKLCTDQTFQPGLWLFCHSGCGTTKKSMCGGLNNARNRVQTCLRLAVDMGASGIIVGGVTARSETDLLNTGQSELPPEAWWNTDTMQKTIEHECPMIEMQFGEPRLNNSRTIAAPSRTYTDGSHTKGTFRDIIVQTLKENKIQIDSINTGAPVVVEFFDTFIAWDYGRSGELSTVRRDLFKAVTYNKTMLAMGHELFSTRSLAHRDFIGVHFRGESDWPAPFGSATDQINGYMDSVRAIKASHPAVRHVYVSCGDRDAINNLRKPLQAIGYIVHDKWSLSEQDHIQVSAAMKSLDFDQRAIIEYEMLTRAKFFLGPAMSTMSLLVAFARTVDHDEDFFTTYLYPNSTLQGQQRIYTNDKVMRGPMSTQLLVMSSTDITPFFP